MYVSNGAGTLARMQQRAYLRAASADATLDLVFFFRHYTLVCAALHGGDGLQPLESVKRRYEEQF